MSELSLKQKLSLIQLNVKASKSQFNKFGNYNYRSLEDILEALKPLLNKYQAVLLLDNKLEVFNGIVFRKSIATLSDLESEDEICVSTYTQEAIEKKGMSPEQCSGSAASYADKYCLNKMFLLDDAKDADTNEAYKQSQQNPIPRSSNRKNIGPSENQIKFYRQLCEKLNFKIDEEWIKKADIKAMSEAINGMNMALKKKQNG